MTTQGAFMVKGIALILALLLTSSSVLADWVELANFKGVAEVSVVPGEIKLNLRLRDSVAPAHFSLPGKSLAELPPWMSAQLPPIQAKGGKPLLGRLQSLGHQPAGPSSPPIGDSSVGFYEAVLSYPIEEQLEGLSITPPEEAGQPMGLVLLHRGVPVADLMALKQTVKVSLNWLDPWQTRFDDPTLIRRHTDPRSYVYIESYEVRHELLLRLKDIKQWLDLGLIDNLYVEESEREGLKTKIGNFLLTKNPLVIDGSTVSPQLDWVEFVHYDRSGVMPVSGEGRLETETALVGVMLSYLTEQPARSVRLQWDLFEESAPARQVSLNMGKETFDAYMTSKQPVFDWSLDESLNPATFSEDDTDLMTDLPTELGHAPSQVSAAWVIAVILIGLSVLLFRPSLFRHRHPQTWLGMSLILTVGLLFHPLMGRLAGKVSQNPTTANESQIKALLQPLLHNAYRAFPLRDEEKAYDRLAKSLDGDLLEAIYLQQRKAILRQSKGLGGEGRVDRIELLESHALGLGQPPGVLSVTSRWLAHGTVSHWGHSHERHNLYQARLTLRLAPGEGWKIVGMEFLDGQRLEPGAS